MYATILIIGVINLASGILVKIQIFFDTSRVDNPNHHPYPRNVKSFTGRHCLTLLPS